MTKKPFCLFLLQVTPLAVGVSSFAAASFDRWIYVIGGGPNGKLATDKVQCWEPGTECWELRTPIPIETKCTNAVTFKSYIYLVGKFFGECNQIHILCIHTLVEKFNFMLLYTSMPLQFRRNLFCFYSTKII